MKAYMSEPGAKRTMRNPVKEAQRILADTEGINPEAGIYGETVSVLALRRARRAAVQGLPYRWSIHTDHGCALAEALAAFVGGEA